MKFAYSLADIVFDNRERSYSRELATYQVETVKRNKFWPTVNRIDDVYGHRNLMCSCPSIDSYRD